MFQKVHVFRLQRGMIIPQSLAAFCRERGITSGIIIGMIGSLNWVRLAKLIPDHSKFGEAYDEYQGPLAITAAQGSISTFNDELVIHIHSMLAGYGETTAIGGHFVEGEVMNTTEVYLGELDFALVRQIDPTLGTPELVTPEGPGSMEEMKMDNKENDK